MLKGVLVWLHSMHLRYYEKVVSQTSKQLQHRGYKIEDISGWTHSSILSLDWFKGKYAGKPHMSWEKQWFPVDFPLNQSNGLAFVMVGVSDTKNHPLFLRTLAHQLRHVSTEPASGVCIQRAQWEAKGASGTLAQQSDDEIPFSSWNQQQFNPELPSGNLT